MGKNLIEQKWLGGVQPDTRERQVRLPKFLFVMPLLVVMVFQYAQAAPLLDTHPAVTKANPPTGTAPHNVKSAQMSADSAMPIWDYDIPVWTIVLISATAGLVIGVLYFVGYISKFAKLRLDELRRSEARYHSMADDHETLIVCWAANGARTFVNHSYSQSLGVSREELIGTNVFLPTTPGFRDGLKEKFLALTADHPVAISEHIEIAADGGVRCQRWTDRAIFDANGIFIECQSMGRDVTQHVEVQNELRSSEEKFFKAFHSSSDAVLITRIKDGLFVEVNEGFERITGYNRAHVVGKTVFDIDLWKDPKERKALVYALKETGRVRDMGVRFRAKSGEIKHCMVSAEHIKVDADDCVLSITRDITEYKTQLAAFEFQATHDSLTGLPNRQYLYTKLNESIRVSKCAGEALGLLLMDLNRFKEINDTLGHQSGDVLLKQMADRLEYVAGDRTVFVARLGGDEFAIIVRELGGGSIADKAISVAQIFLEAVEQPFLLDGMHVEVSASIGIAVYPDHGEDVSTLMRFADVAMYEAKRNVKGCSIYSPEHDNHTPRRLALMTELGAAIRGNQLVLHYQPKQDLLSGRVVGMEALVRWKHPEHGLIRPDQFIPLAEIGELITPLTHWVIHTSMGQWRNWHTRDLPVQIAVNISTRNLLDRELPTHLERLLRKHNADPSALELEITESAIMADPERALEVLKRVHEMGIQLSIDDFGTGYSSLAYLKRLPIQMIKIDASFVRNMVYNDQDAIIVKSIINLAHNLGLKVLAEGVEDKITLDMLSDFGCDQVQGYCIGRPMNAKLAGSWISNFDMEREARPLLI
ncbi:MAG: EAL domain-containing protein [Gammaproteobacteria bacterium]|nr:EAL domain-containing protein [Gammaproteobacteria bacterium]